MSEHAVFVADGDAFVPTPHAQGPWDPGAMHGGAPGGLVARAVERCEPTDGTVVARLSLDLLSPVPMRPIEVRAHVVKPGRSTQVVEADVICDGRTVARARALRIRRTPVDGIEPPDDPVPGSPSEAKDIGFGPGVQGGFVGAHDILFVRGRELPGPATVWMRLRVPLVEGEEPSGLQRVVCAADFANGVAAPLDWDRYVFINPDLNVHLHREPEGEWVCLDARSLAQANGVGQSDTALYDTGGRIGRSVQSLYIDVRSG